MPKLHLKDLQCNETEDNAGADECELRVWCDDRYYSFRRNMNNGDTWTLDISMPFRSRAKIQLWDLDRPDFPLYDDHDHLGTAVIRAAATQGAETTFNQDGADYVLHYDVLP